jgi:UDP-N-acetylmuramoylalanine--D-glutamate ligase
LRAGAGVTLRRVRPPLLPGPYLVVGLARSGVAAATVLAARGETVVGVDAGSPDMEPIDGVELVTGSDGVDLLESVGCVVKSPGVPKEAAVVAAARERGLPVLGELELAWRLLPNPWIAITGSNGKTTTVELVGHLHRAAGVPVTVAGNVGTALSSLVGAIGPDVVIAAEASSFQLEDTLEFAPDAGVLLNLAEDHLDRHGTMEAYRAAKLEVFARQTPEQVAVLPVSFEAGGAGKRVRFGRRGDVEARDGRLWWRGLPLLEIADLRVRGAHNVENAMAAAAVCLARGLDPEAVAAGLRTFAGVPHRLEEVATLDGVLFVNDSKATNVASAVVGLESFDAPVHVILGGQGKGADFAPLADAVAARARAAYLIGEDAPLIRTALSSAGVPLHDCGDLERAVAAAQAAAQPGEIVLLSPACASFDQYADFEARGGHFRALVSG